MFLVLLSFVAFFFCAWVYSRWRKVKRFWQERGVPHYPPHPIMGSLTFLQRENPTIWMRKLYKDFNAAPYVGMWQFWRPALVVNCPEIARRVLVKDADVFRNRYLSSGKTDPLGALNIFTVNDPIWTPLRRRLTTVFTAAKLRGMNRITAAKAQDLLDRIEKDTDNNKIIDLRNICTDYTTDVIGESAFGVTSNYLATSDSIIRTLTKEFMKFDWFRGLSWSSIFFFPDLVDIFRFSFYPKNTEPIMREVFRSVIQQRGGYNKEVKDPKDLLDALLKMKQDAAKENDNALEMTEDFLASQAAVFLLGGFDTTGSALTWCFYELAWHPQYQERLYQDLLEVKDKIGDVDFDAAVLSEVPFLDCVIKEALRIFPPMGWLDRKASKDYKIDENLTIPAGTTVYVNGVSMQMDTRYFPEPEVYNPERFLPENERNIKPYTYMPFGEGPRSCIGIRFAYQTLRQGLAKVLLNYEVRTLPNYPKPNDCAMEKKGMLFMPAEKMAIEFVRRDNKWTARAK